LCTDNKQLTTWPNNYSGLPSKSYKFNSRSLSALTKLHSD
jgi:hypothetical protein